FIASACARGLHIQAGVGRRAQPNAVLEKVFTSITKVMTPGLYHYYVTELAFYWSLMFSQFTDIKRKVSVTQVQCLFSQTTEDPPQGSRPLKH
ncbi:hypothetical protein XENOCAPTIV_016771, partial [Xenoophorus captivus]